MKRAGEVTIEGQANSLELKLTPNFWAEHECGIDSIRRKLKAELKELPKDLELNKDFLDKMDFSKKLWEKVNKLVEETIESKRIKSTQHIKYKENDNFLLLMVQRYIDDKPISNEEFRNLIAYFNSTDYTLNGAWDDQQFIVICDKRDSESYQKIKTLINLIEQGKCFLTGAIKITSEDFMKQGDLMEDMQENALRSIACNMFDKAWGHKVKQELKKAGKDWFALSPNTLDEEGMESRSTKYPLIYWLNPYEQKIHNYGWFTVEELELWTEDKGPIMS